MTKKLGNACKRCGSDSGDKSYCKIHASENARYTKELRDRRKAAGQCLRCGVPKEGHVHGRSFLMCRPCGGDVGHGRRDHVAMGMCYHCKELQVSGTTLCEKHLVETSEATRDRSKNRYLRFKKSSMCIRCGKPPRPGKSRCDECLLYARRHAKMARRLDLG